jgi:hypothetical protein
MNVLFASIPSFASSYAAGSQTASATSIGANVRKGDRMNLVEDAALAAVPGGFGKLKLALKLAPFIARAIVGFVLWQRGSLNKANVGERDLAANRKCLG